MGTPKGPCDTKAWRDFADSHAWAHSPGDMCVFTHAHAHAHAPYVTTAQLVPCRSRAESNTCGSFKALPDQTSSSETMDKTHTRTPLQISGILTLTSICTTSAVYPSPFPSLFLPYPMPGAASTSARGRWVMDQCLPIPEAGPTGTPSKQETARHLPW